MDVRAQLARMLASRLFRGRTGRFLQFAVEATLAGRELKEYIVATEVFGRPASFDPRADAIVRVEAVKLRARIDEYFSSVGRADPVIIEVPKGAYTAVFRERPAGIRSVAVLPFVNLGGDDWFSGGLTEELTDALTRCAGLRVVSAFALEGHAEDARQVGERLGVDALVEGSVRRSGGKLRITAQLTETARGFHLWSGSFDRAVDDVFEVQQEIAAELARRVSRTAPKRRGPASVEALDLYLRGRHAANQWDPGAHARARALFEEAMGKDPAYALPHAALGRLLVLESIYGRGQRPREVMPQARAAAERALQLDPDAADAHGVLGTVHARYGFDSRAAEEAFLRALAVNPSAGETRHFYAHDVLLMRGRFEEALEQMALAREVDPLSSFIRVGWPWVLLYAGQADEAIRELEQLPRELPVLMALGWARVHKGEYEAALPPLEEVARLVPGPDGCAFLGYAYGRAGRRADAERLLADLAATPGYVRPTAPAMIHLGLGNHEAALENLETAYEERESFLIFSKVEPAFDPLRGEPRFQRIVELTSR